jgi:xylan 1,4-beta-xylosidase
VAVHGGTGYDARRIVHGSVREAPDVNAFAARDEREATILLWNYHDDDVAAAPAVIQLRVEGIPEDRILLHHYRIDGDHSNAYEAWKRMGSPQEPSSQQYAELERASELALLESPAWHSVRNGSIAIRLTLPRQGVSLLRLSWQP